MLMIAYCSLHCPLWREIRITLVVVIFPLNNLSLYSSASLWLNPKVGKELLNQRHICLSQILKYFARFLSKNVVPVQAFISRYATTCFLYSSHPGVITLLGEEWHSILIYIPLNFGEIEHIFIYFYCSFVFLLLWVVISYHLLIFLIWLFPQFVGSS